MRAATVARLSCPLSAPKNAHNRGFATPPASASSDACGPPLSQRSSCSFRRSTPRTATSPTSATRTPTEWIDRFSLALDDPEILGVSNTGYGPNMAGTVCRTATYPGYPTDPDGTPRASTDRFPRDGVTVTTDTYRWRATGRWMVPRPAAGLDAGDRAARERRRRVLGGGLHHPAATERAGPVPGQGAVRLFRRRPVRYRSSPATIE